MIRWWLANVFLDIVEPSDGILKHNEYRHSTVLTMPWKTPLHAVGANLAR